jgi:DNA polymerase-3 subunit gamma/tau
LCPKQADDPSLTQTERERGAEYAGKLSTAILSRVWQMLLKGISETEGSSRPAAAAEMALIRIAHAAKPAFARGGAEGVSECWRS